jgi:hypothetical protein
VPASRSGKPVWRDNASTTWADAVICASVSGLSGFPLSACSMEYQRGLPSNSAQAIQPFTGPNWWMWPFWSMPKWAEALKPGLLKTAMVPGRLPTIVCITTPMISPGTCIPGSPFTHGHGWL